MARCAPAGGYGLTMAPSLLAFDIWVMLAVALACLQVFLTGREIARWEGAALAAQQHDALRTYTLAMTGLVLPLTVMTVLRQRRTTPS